MIREGYLVRHRAAFGVERSLALLDVAQEYVLEALRREGLFDGTLVFKGGTALRKFVFGPSGRFSTDLDFGLQSDHEDDGELLFLALDGHTLFDVSIRVVDRRGPHARLTITTPLGVVGDSAFVSIRLASSWLPPVLQPPQPFPFLDGGLAGEFTRSPLPIVDPREIAAEKIAAFRRRRKARDLYDLEHLGRTTQASFDGPAIAELAALKIYFDLVDEGLGIPPVDLATVFDVTARAVTEADQLGVFRAAIQDPAELLARCRSRYTALRQLPADLIDLLVRGNPRDRHWAQNRKTLVVERLTATS